MNTYTVRFSTHSGMSYPMARGVSFTRARELERRRKKAFRRMYSCCSYSLTRRGQVRTVEFTDCGNHLISDLHGFMTTKRETEGG